MAQRNLDIIVSAKDEASGTFNRVGREMRSLHEAGGRGGEGGGGGGLFASAKALNAESRASGEAGFERMLRGAGAFGLATFAMEGLTRATETLRESLDKLQAGEMSASEVVGSVTQSFVQSIPVLNKFVEGFRSMIDAAEDGIAALTGDESLQSDNTRLEHAKKYNEVLDKTTESLHKLQDDAKLSGLRGRAKEIEQEEVRYREQQAKLAKERSEAGKGLDKLGPEYKHLLAVFAQERDLIDKAHENRLREITEKPMSHRLAGANDDPHLTALKEIAEERMALLNSPKEDPTTKAVKEGNKINEKGYKDVVKAVTRPEAPAPAAGAGGRPPGPKPFDWNGAMNPPNPLLGGPDKAPAPGPAAAASAPHADAPAAAHVAAKKAAKDGYDRYLDQVAQSRKYAGTVGSDEYYVDSHGRRHGYTAEHPRPGAATTMHSDYGRSKELAREQRDGSDQKMIAHLASIEASLKAIAAKSPPKHEPVFGHH